MAYGIMAVIFSVIIVGMYVGFKIDMMYDKLEDKIEKERYRIEKDQIALYNILNAKTNELLKAHEIDLKDINIIG